MKRFLSLSVIALLVLTSSYVVAKHFWRGPTLSVKEVCERWGEKDFNLETFKTGDAPAKASMACSLLKKQKEYLGTPLADIRGSFGDFSGYYFSDTYPVYIIQRGENRKEETWQIVFLIAKDRTVSEIIVHKNCCD